MNKKIILTESERKTIIANKEKAIIESFAKTFNKIKRIDENELNQVGGEHVGDGQINDKEIHSAAVTGFKELKNNVGEYSKSVENVSPEQVEKLKNFLEQKTGKSFESIGFSDL